MPRPSKAAGSVALVTDFIAVDVHATDREQGTGQQGELCQTMINFV